MSADARAYWLWLQHAFGPGSPKPFYFYRRFSSLQELYQGGAALWSSFSFVSEKELQALRGFSLNHALAQIEYAEKTNQQVLTPECAEYPDALRHIENPPAVLYLRGELPEVDERLTIGVVGSRSATESAVKTAKLVSYELSKAGAVVVSGGALGVDAAAHRGAMMGCSPTVCVLACGIDYPYLMENQFLRGRIVETGGALISEYPVNTGVNKGVFAVRNRIISGISHGLLVVEGKAKSGTSITAAHALRQNREVFAVPGDVNNPQAEGPNALIADGAKPVCCGQDILREYAGRFRSVPGSVPPAQTLPQPEKGSVPSGLSAQAGAVFSCLGESPVHISQICAHTGLRASQVLTAATELELLGHISSYSGQRFSLK